jgi:NCAIR mutase (PurE)-related protein
MDEQSFRGVLERYKGGEITLPEALDELRDFPFKDLSFARLDTQREIRVGYPEIVYCAGKSAEQLRGARVVAAVAGMEGALPSVIGGLVQTPVIAVPTIVWLRRELSRSVGASRHAQ